MWAFRRATIPLRNRGFTVRASCASCVKLLPTICVEDEAGISESPQILYSGFLSSKTFYHAGQASLKFAVSGRELCSQADVSSTKEEDDLEDGFSELETSAVGESESILTSDTDLSDDNEDAEEPHNELELSDTETDPTEKKSPPKRATSELFNAIISAPALSVRSALAKWDEGGKELSRQEISLAMVNLRKYKQFGKALELSEWIESKFLKHEFTEKDYASRLDLIAKLHGLHKAENYIWTIPKSFRGEIIYRTLLVNCVTQNNLKKAEEIFNKMKDLDFPVTVFSCNQLLLLYKRNYKNKIADVLLLMEKENIKPSLLTYKLLIDAKGRSDDIDGMDQIVETMIAEGVEPDIQIKAVLARHYISAGLAEKAETILKEMEGENLKQNRWVCQSLLPLYANLGKVGEVRRIWEFCKSNPRIEECLAAIEAWGKLNNIEEAEAAFEMISKRWKLTSKYCSVLLKVYGNHNMLMKGKDLIKRMADSGCRIGPLTWDALVKLYLRAGEVEKADSLLQKVNQQSGAKPILSTYVAVLEQHAKRGDVHNSEKIFYRMKQAGYTLRLRLFQVLIQAYINAKLPAYGIRERMKADGFYPDKAISNQLALVDGFRRNPVSELLD